MKEKRPNRWRERMQFRDAVRDSLMLRTSEKLVAWIVESHVDQETLSTYVSEKKLAEECGMSPRAVRRALSLLSRLGFIEVAPRPGSSWLRTIKTPDGRSGVKAVDSSSTPRTPAIWTPAKTDTPPRTNGPPILSSESLFKNPKQILKVLDRGVREARPQLTKAQHLELIDRELEERARNRKPEAGA